MKLIEDLGLMPYGSQGRSARFGLYECPMCHNHFKCRSDDVASGNTTKCRSCANKHRNDAKYAKAAEEFLEKAKAIHGDNYDYTHFQYNGALSKSKFGCRVHGIFEQTASSHLSGRGCPQCGAESTGKIKADKAAATFIEKAKAIHGDLWGYHLVDYTDARTKVEFICNEHGIYKQSPDKHLQGQGCPQCAIIRRDIALRMTENNDITTLLYYIHFPEVNLWKIGCTSRTLAERFSQDKLQYTIIQTKEYASGNEAYRVEKFILDATKETQYKDVVLKGGNTELRTQPIENFESLLEEAELYVKEQLC